VKQASQTLFWLLIAATLAVDAVVISNLLAAGPMSRVSFVYDGLMTGQLAVVCLWGMFAARRSWSAWLGVLAAVGVAGGLMAWVAELPFLDGAGIYGCFAALLAGVMWGLKRIALWQRLVASNVPVRWQFSLGHLLAAMTVVAVLITALRGSLLLFSAGDTWKLFISLTLADVILVTGTVLVWMWSAALPYGWARLGATLAPALVVGAGQSFFVLTGWLGDELAALQRESPMDFVCYALVVALVLYVYLELAPLIAVGPAAEKPTSDAG